MFLWCTPCLRVLLTLCVEAEIASENPVVESYRSTSFSICCSLPPSLISFLSPFPLTISLATLHSSSTTIPPFQLLPLFSIAHSCLHSYIFCPSLFLLVFFSPLFSGTTVPSGIQSGILSPATLILLFSLLCCSACLCFP